MSTRRYLTFTLLASLCWPSQSRNRAKRKPLENYGSFRPKAFTGGTFGEEQRFSIADMNCSFFVQPLNHFDLPRNKSGTFKERYCVYNGFVRDKLTAPVFFYTGNESPLEQYINQTGLIWETAPRFGAQVMFIEHRYEGQSLPNPNIPKCMAYASSIQALADYANFIERHVFIDPTDTTLMRRRPVVAFGGSYGGMLSAWLRNIYPNTVVGAIAASAPTLGFPRNYPNKIDAAYRVIKHGLQQSYPPTNPQRSDNFCYRNLIVAWPLIKALGSTPNGRALLSKQFRLCDPLTEESKTDILINWAQSPWFDMAEGSFPYPSSYIPFALLHKIVELPPWPVQAACWQNSDLHKDWGVKVVGSLAEVLYDIEFGQEGLRVGVDWNEITSVSWPADPEKLSSVKGLLSSVRDAVSVWFNVTKDQQCYDLTAAPNLWTTGSSSFRKSSTFARKQGVFDSIDQCRAAMSKGSWRALCCNEEMNLIITEACGLGYDFIWPPSHPRGTTNHKDVVELDETNPQELFCRDPDGALGYPQDRPDPWSTFYDTVFGGTATYEYQSNIVYSNGLLDPWSAAGVYRNLNESRRKDGLYVQNLGRSAAAVLMEYGGHHTDLMYSNVADPPCVSSARQVETYYISRWINEFWESQNLTQARSELYNSELSPQVPVQR